MRAVTLGVDIGKRWFHVIGLNSTGRVVLREKLTREQLLHRVVAMEACCGSQHLRRIAASFGQDVRLIPAQHVQPFVKSHKNDFNDATALAEVARLPSMRAVPLSSIEQIDLQSVHRARQRLLEHRNGMTNQIRGLLLDRGIAIPQWLYPLRTSVPANLERAANGLTAAFRELLSMLLQMWRQTEVALEHLSEQLRELAHVNESCRRPQSIPGVGPSATLQSVRSRSSASLDSDSRSR